MFRNKFLSILSVFVILMLAVVPVGATYGDGYTGTQVLANGCVIPTPEVCQWNATLHAHDPLCVEPPPPPVMCEWDDQILASDPLCAPPPPPIMCAWNDQILATDPLCLPPPPPIMCEWDEQILASDPLCVEPPPPPVFCGAQDTGKDLFQLYMFNTDPNHYGYFVENAVKVGVCQIVTDGNFPNSTSVSTGCECGLPADFVWTTTGFDVYHVWVNCKGEYFYRDSEGHTVVPFGTFVFGQYCSIAECPLR